MSQSLAAAGTPAGTAASTTTSTVAGTAASPATSTATRRATSPVAGTADGPAAELVLAGDLSRPARLTVPDLLGWPQHQTEVAFECATSGVRHHRFTGPLLHEVLADAGPGFDPARRKDRLRFLIAVSGADGHHALLSWAEIDPDFGRAPVLLAVTIDDTPLDHAGPQLVLPQDRCGARHISGVNAIRVDGGYTSWA
ncbi:molybdopterin-dependent oxidoreductase [Streptomyces sp. NPDC102259]|uniref:molybdopterin-dependent oxidoreductase n=1 Tax=Streptomyces sp. NPDC102259 TaxID=3366148 RepID=UPI0038147F52